MNSSDNQMGGTSLDWMAVLTAGSSTRTMVIGFVNSAEYRQRFGPSDPDCS